MNLIEYRLNHKFIFHYQNFLSTNPNTKRRLIFANQLEANSEQRQIAFEI